MTFSVDKVRADFPVLSREVNGLPLAYLDSAASAQKPSQVIDSEAEFYRHGYAAVHRGIHTLSAQATEKMENVRKRDHFRQGIFCAKHVGDMSNCQQASFLIEQIR